MESAKEILLNVDKNILDLFYSLSNENTDIRLQACSDIFFTLWRKQKEEDGTAISKDLKYTIERLVKGLASPRESARLGYTLLLTQILNEFDNVQIGHILEVVKKNLTISNQQEKRDNVFGQLFVYAAIIRSGKLTSSEHLTDVVLSVYDLCGGKTYIVNPCHELFQEYFPELPFENFKEKVWPQLKKKLKSGWDNCSAESLWMLLLCIHYYSDCVTAKYLRNHWGSEDIFAVDNLEHMKKIIKKTTSCLPTLHPLCSVFCEVVRPRKDFSELWNTVVDENLFNLEQTEKACVGFGMIKLVLQKSPTKKIVRKVLSTKFLMVFSKSFQSSKHPLNPAANHLATFMCNLSKDTTIPDIQILILNAFIQPSGTIMLDQILKKKEVSMIIQCLLPDAVKAFCENLKAVLLKKELNGDINEKECTNMKRLQAAHQIANLVSHPSMLADIEWRLDVIKFMFLHSFFTIKVPTMEVPHCNEMCSAFPDSLRDSFTNEFFRAVNSLHIIAEKKQSSLDDFLQYLMVITEFAEQLMNATDNAEGRFSMEKIEGAWKHLKSVIHKLSKQSQKDGQVNESNAFQTLFLQLGLLLFQDPEHISEVLEELYICCKKALKIRKKGGDISDEMEESSEKEPPWIGVVIDILLSLLSKSSRHLRNLVTFVFPLFCPFVTQEALQQILDVINPQQEDEDMLIDEADEDAKDVDFGSGSSSDESEDELENQNVDDDDFKRKVENALGSAVDGSDAESIVLSDSEMFKLDDALSEAFKSRQKAGHTQFTSEDKTLLHFRIRCFDLIMAYLKSEPPLNLALMCIEPVLAAYELGHQSKQQSPLMTKAVAVLQFISKMKKFKDHDNVNKQELKRLLEVLIPKCHREINMGFAQKLYSLCVFIVLCYRKLGNAASPDKKSSKTPSYVKLYLSNLDTFVSKGTSNLCLQFFTQLMEACPDLAWHFIEPCKNYSFNNNTRLFKRTQCLGLLLEALKYSKNQNKTTPDQWLEFGNSVFPVTIECLKDALNAADMKPLYVSELLTFIYTIHIIVKEKTCQLLFSKYESILSVLQEISKENLKKMNRKGKSMRIKIINYFERRTDSSLPTDVSKKDTSSSPSSSQKRTVLETETGETLVECSKSAKKKRQKKRKSSENCDTSTIFEGTETGETLVNGNSKSEKKKKQKKKKSLQNCNTITNSDRTETDETLVNGKGNIKSTKKTKHGERKSSENCNTNTVSDSEND